MTIVETMAEVDASGRVTVAVPEPFAGQGRRIRVVLSVAEAPVPTPHESWADLVARTAGSIDRDTFVRPPQPSIRPSSDLR